MIRIFLTLVILVFTGCTMENTKHIKELQKEALDNSPHEGTVLKNIVYKSTLFHDIKLDLYQPLNRVYKKAPIYIYIHGGSWLYGDKDLVNIYDKTVKKLRESGVAVVSIDYRMVSQSGILAMVEDCNDAVIYLQNNADKYELNAHYIGLHGHSAGANLALVTGFTLSKISDDIHFIVDEYGPTDVVDLLNNAKKRTIWSYLIPDRYLEALSPLRMIHKDIPTVYIAHGNEDKTVPLEQSKKLYEAIKKQGLDVEFEIVEGADHGYVGLDTTSLEKHRTKVLVYILDKFKELDIIKP